MTVSQFQDWHNVIKTERDLFDREVKLLSIVSGKTVEYLEDLPLEDLRKLFRQMNKIDTKLNDKPKRIVSVKLKPFVAFCLPSEISDKLSTNQYTALKTYTATEEDTIKNMHKILALTYAPYRLFRKPKLSEYFNKIEERMKSAKMGDISGTVFLLSRIGEITRSFPALFNQGNGNDTEVQRRDDAWGRFSESWGWYNTLDWVVTNTPNVTEDEVGEWTAIRFLNRIQYLKQKHEVIEFERSKNIR